MGYVTKTITDRVGESMTTTSYHFESYEDFLAWENTDEPLEINSPICVSRGEWKVHDGKSVPIIPFGTDFEVMLRSGCIYQGGDVEYWYWPWLDGKTDNEIIKYRIVKEK